MIIFEGVIYLSRGDEGVSRLRPLLGHLEEVGGALVAPQGLTLLVLPPKEASKERLGGVELLLGLCHQLQGLCLVVGHDEEGLGDDDDDGFLLCDTSLTRALAQARAFLPLYTLQLLPGG